MATLFTPRLVTFRYSNRLVSPSGVTESLLGVGAEGGRPSSGREGGQEDGIAMKSAQSKVQWGDPWCEWGDVVPPLVSPRHCVVIYADTSKTRGYSI